METGCYSHSRTHSTVHSSTPAILALPTSSPPKGSRLRARVAALVRFRQPARAPSTPSLVLPDPDVPHPDRTSIDPPVPPFHSPAISAASSLPEHHPPPMAHPAQYTFPPPPPPKANLKTWWRHFTFVQSPKRATDAPYKPQDTADHPVFGKSLTESLNYASVQISTANASGDLYVWGYIPVVVAKCGLYLKENATEVPGTFRVNGSNKRMRDLQAAFETPPRYGKSLDWRQETYTTHDVASVFRRYLTQMPEPVIPYDMYHLFRDALAKTPFNHEETVSTCKSLIRRMPKPNQYLLLYVLDLLSVFARKNDKNLMTATNLAVIFRPGILSHHEHEMSPQEHALSQRVLEFLIAQQDWFMLDISPPPGTGSGSAGGGSGHGHGGGSGSGHGHGGGGSGGQGGGKWRDGPSRKGTGDSAGAGAGAGATGGPSGTVAAAAVGTSRNAEAGSSRKRVSLPAPMSTSVAIWEQEQTPAQQIVAQALQAQVSSLRVQGQAYGQLTEDISPPPSPTSTGLPHRASSPLGQHRKTASHPANMPSSQPASPSSQPHPTPGKHPQANVPYFPPIYAALHSTIGSQPQPSPAEPPQPFSSLTTQPLPSGASDLSSIMVIPTSPSTSSSVDVDMEDDPLSLGSGWKLVSRGLIGYAPADAAHAKHGFGVSYGGGYGTAVGGGGFLALGKERERGGRAVKGKEDKENKEREKRELRMVKRRTAHVGELVAPVLEDAPSSSTAAGSVASGASVRRSRTLPSRRRKGDAEVEVEDSPELSRTLVLLDPLGPAPKEKEREGLHKEKRVLKKQRRASGQPPSSATNTTTTPVLAPALFGSRTPSGS